VPFIRLLSPRSPAIGSDVTNGAFSLGSPSTCVRIVTSASGLFADAVAEQTLALLLGLLRGLPTFFRQQQRREFVRRPTRDLHGATVGIVGLGWLVPARAKGAE
jgi:phosphoglycerate dehydrogenase-like enzyme